jgi:hypothetical protein
MIRQARTYLVGAMSGATLIAIAIAVFVLLVSAQVFRDWPIAALGSGDDAAAVSDAKPAGPGGTLAGQQASPAAGGRGAATGGSDGNGGASGQGDGSLASVGNGSQPSAPGQGGAPGSGSGGGGSGGQSPAQAPGTSASSGGGGGGGSASGGSGGATTPSGKAAETVNNTVNQVDESALGGTLNDTGATDVTEGAVNGVAGPESPVGKVVDEVTGAVDGVLGR